MNAQHPLLSSDPSGLLSPVLSAQDDRRQAMRRIAGVGALMAASAALGGCGFALRRAATVSFDTLYVASTIPSPVLNALRRELESSGIQVVAGAPSGSQAKAVVLTVLSDQRERAVVGQTTSGQVRELELRHRFRFNVATTSGRWLIRDQELALQRSISFSETDVLSKSAEEQSMYADLLNDVVKQVMRRLAAIKEF